MINSWIPVRSLIPLIEVSHVSKPAQPKRSLE